MSALGTETVLSVHHWTDNLFSFRLTRDPGFRFKSGQFTMLGLPVNGKPLLRAYSLASANYEEEIEIFSIKVQDGPLTSQLQHLKVGDQVILGRKPTGTLIQDNLLPGKRLFLLGTGTGLAPFLSLVKDPEVLDSYEQIVLVHGVREVAELAYRDYLTEELPKHEFLGELVSERLTYYPTVTREPFENRGRITDLIEGGRLFNDLGIDPIDPADDRVMVCGSPAMLADTVSLLEGRGFVEGSGNKPGSYTIEKAFAEHKPTPANDTVGPVQKAG